MPTCCCLSLAVFHGLQAVDEVSGLYSKFHMCIRNQCNRPIAAAIHYKAGGSWVTKGWWVAHPGQKKCMATTTNKYWYLYARTTGHHHVAEWGNPDCNNCYWHAPGGFFPFRKESSGAHFNGDHTINLTC